MIKNTREISSEIIDNIYKNISFEQSIQNSASYKKLESREQSLTRMIVLTFLRRNGEVNNVISKYLKKSINKKAMNILRVGCTQILFLNTPEYSVVNESVEIVKKKFPYLSGLVNAILRNISRNKSKLACSTNHQDNLPEWIRGDWIKSYGLKEMKSFAEQIKEKPFIDIKIKKSFLQKRDWEKILNGRNIYADIIRLKNTSKVDELPFFQNGEWWVQSLSASIPVKILETIYEKNPTTQKSILEVGPSPGGKTFQLSENNYEVTAVEISKKRISRLKENLQRLGFKVKIVNNDILKYDSSKKFNFILIDAPCSGSGILSKKPEILVQNKSSDLDSLLKKQEKILYKCSNFLKPKGIMLYSVCSLISSEGKLQIDRFLKQNKNFKLEFLDREILRNFDCDLNQGMLTIKPNGFKDLGGLDGFFIACVRRIN